MYNQQQRGNQQRTISDIELISLWLQQIPPRLQSSHLYIAQMFLKFVKKPLAKVTPTDVAAFANFKGLRSENIESHKHKRLEVINSLIQFGQETGILPTIQKKTLYPISTPTKKLQKSAPSTSRTGNFPKVMKVQKKSLNWSKLLNSQLLSSVLIVFIVFIAISQIFKQLGGSQNTRDGEWPETVVEMPEIDPTENWAYPINKPRIRAFLDTISVTEGTAGPQGYYRQYTGSHFSSFEDHPREMKCGINIKNEQLCSDAAGRYQFLSTSWDLFASQVKAKNFGPTYQDRVAVELIRDKGALEDIEEGRIEEAFKKLYMVWPSFGETATDVERKMPELVGIYNEKLSLYMPDVVSSPNN
ncbi:MAG: glycoside hydrolase family 104 protein [Microcoleaceae cyanobacterium MO_207.B10]|nr:glycoside hydrolase family 104 protein [Microcoleaceae cyanobacterium MO_207.B10]